MISSHLVNVGPLVFGGVFAVIGLIALGFLPLIIVIVANRAEADARGMRPFTVYLFAMAFVTLMLAYAGLTLIVTSLLRFVSPHDLPIGTDVGRSCVIGGLFLLIAGGTMMYHYRQGLASARGDERVDGPNARVLHTYIGVVSFIFFLTAIIALGFSLYSVFELIRPGVFGGADSRTATLNQMLDYVYLLVASMSIVMYTWRQAPPGMLRKPAMPHMPHMPSAPTPPAPPES
jgi:hypothetical protein